MCIPRSRAQTVERSVDDATALAGGRVATEGAIGDRRLATVVKPAASARGAAGHRAGSEGERGAIAIREVPAVDEAGVAADRAPAQISAAGTGGHAGTKIAADRAVGHRELT